MVYDDIKYIQNCLNIVFLFHVLWDSLYYKQNAWDWSCHIELSEPIVLLFYLSLFLLINQIPLNVSRKKTISIISMLYSYYRKF